jgi:quercetin dioxygenase-like cupin family protein
LLNINGGAGKKIISKRTGYKTKQTMKQPKEIIHVGQLELRFLLDGDDTNHQMMLFESVFPGGAKVAVPPHYHSYADEMIYMLEGVLAVTIDGARQDIGAGESRFIPKRSIHHIANNTSKTARALGLITPAIIPLSYFREISELFKTGTFSDLEKVREIMLRNDTIPVMSSNN